MNVHSLLKKYNVHPKKRFGQNFLIAFPTIEKIARCLNPSPADKVLEIGPGPGIMTKILSDMAGFVAAIESDREMIKILEDEWGSIQNIHVIHGDVLDTDLKKLLFGPIPARARNEQTGQKWLFAGNIPYNITSPLLFHIRRFRSCFKHGVITVQKEVANRLVASPGNKDYGILSIGLQVVSRVEKCFNISPKSFYPSPKVESTVIKITFLDEPLYNIKDLDHFTLIVRMSFGMRRKTIKNSLLQSKMLTIETDRVIDSLKKAGIPEGSRAEDIDIESFARLAEHLKT